MIENNAFNKELVLQGFDLNKKYDVTICDVFKKIEFSELKNESLRPEKCFIEIFQFNGSYFEAPNSPLRKAWDAVKTEIFNHAPEKQINDRNDFTKVFNALTIEEGQESIIKAMENYLALEKARDSAIEQLHTLIQYVKKTPAICKQFEHNLKNEREGIRIRNDHLCGYSWDGLISQAYQKKNTEEYDRLVEEKKENDAKLSFIDKLIVLEPLDEKTYQKYHLELFQKLGSEKLEKAEQSILTFSTFPLNSSSKIAEENLNKDFKNPLVCSSDQKSQKAIIVKRPATTQSQEEKGLDWTNIALIVGGITLVGGFLYYKQFKK